MQRIVLFFLFILIPLHTAHASQPHLNRDTLKARIAAKFIMKGGSVDTKNQDGKTLHDRAIETKDTFPTLYQVIMAAKAKQDYEKRIYDQMNIHEPLSLENFKTIAHRAKASPQELEKWQEALKLLQHHCKD